MSRPDQDAADALVLDEVAYLVREGVALDAVLKLNDRGRRLLVEAMRRNARSIVDLLPGEAIRLEPMTALDMERPQGPMLSLCAMSDDELYDIAERAVHEPEAVTLNEIRIMAEYVMSVDDEAD